MCYLRQHSKVLLFFFFSPLTHTELHNPCHTHPTPPHYICLFVTRFACLFLFFPSAKAIIQLNFFAIVCGLFVLFPTFRCYNVQLPVLIINFFFLVLFFSLSFWSQQQAGLVNFSRHAIFFFPLHFFASSCTGHSNSKKHIIFLLLWEKACWEGRTLHTLGGVVPDTKRDQIREIVVGARVPV